MHDDSQRGCMMGCGGPDTFLHYWARCPVFQYLLALIIQPLPFLESPIARLGLCSPCRADFEPAAAGRLLFNAATASRASQADASLPLAG
eukprot:3758674-Pyramimonas_sp.AAC.1